MLALMLAALVALGIWQLQRLAWKEDLIARMTAQMQAPPADLPAMATTDPREWEYRTVRVAGVYNAKHVFWVKPRTQDGVAGAHMLVWLQRYWGQAPVLVNRGFVPEAEIPHITVPQGKQVIEGVVQVPYKFFFTPENNPDKNDWYWADIPAMAAAAGYDVAWPALVTLPPAEGYPAGFAVTAQIRNNHLQYALFWFGMAGILLIVFILHRREKPVRSTPAE